MFNSGGADARDANGARKSLSNGTDTSCIEAKVSYTLALIYDSI
jgi:hypothetical protein